jgi:hypothetical protein
MPLSAGVWKLLGGHSGDAYTGRDGIVISFLLLFERE